MALSIGDEGEEFRFCKRLRESNPREPVCFARKRACPPCFEERAGWMLACCEAKESGMKIDELCAPSLLRTNFSSGRIAANFYEANRPVRQPTLLLLLREIHKTLKEDSTARTRIKASEAGRIGPDGIAVCCFVEGSGWMGVVTLLKPG